MWKLRLQQLNREFGRIMWDIYKCIIYEVYEIWTLLTPSESFVVLQSFSIKNRCFIFLCVSINRRYNPLSLDLTLKVLLRYRKRCKRTKNHLQTISAHNIVLFSHFHSFSRRDGYKSSCNFVYSKLGSVQENHLKRGAFWTGLSEYLLPAEADELLVVLLKLSPVFGREPVWLLARSCWGDPGRDFTDSVEWKLNIFQSLELLRIMFLNSSLDQCLSHKQKGARVRWQLVKSTFPPLIL